MYGLVSLVTNRFFLHHISARSIFVDTRDVVLNSRIVVDFDDYHVYSWLV